MNLRHLSDEQLEENLGRYIEDEREARAKVLHHLKEVERRRLYSKLKFESLFEYAVKKWKFSEGEAYRRIAAMRVLAELPQIEKKIESGELSLSNLAQARTFFRKEKKAHRPKSKEEKMHILSKIENLTKIEAVKVLNGFDPEFKEDGAIDVKFRASKQMQAKIARMRQVLSNSHSGSDLAPVFERALDIALEKTDPMQKARRAEARAGKSGRPGDAAVNQELDQRTRLAGARFIPSSTRHSLYLRDGGCCTNCGSRSQIEVDHVVPVALGGGNELSNLRLLCRSCNQRHAIETYGELKMGRYLEKT